MAVLCIKYVEVRENRKGNYRDGMNGRAKEGLVQEVARL